MKSKIVVFCLSLVASTSAFAAVSPAYVGVAADQNSLESVIKANLSGTDASVSCTDVIFVRLSGSTKVVIAGMCKTNGKAPQMACANLSSNKSALADRSFPELTLESELRAHMTDACELN